MARLPPPRCCFGYGLDRISNMVHPSFAYGYETIEPSAVNREAQVTMKAYLLSFFDKYLRGQDDHFARQAFHEFCAHCLLPEEVKISCTDRTRNRIVHDNCCAFGCNRKRAVWVYCLRQGQVSVLTI